mmetsp:Transcript_22645/g.70513  ORF Transcript_22645/g.70513 Transcript_22645/m.70513 type:complete len:714 (-) Transcript_22645:155-2296(-)
MHAPVEPPPCPCCAERRSAGFRFRLKVPAPPDACEVCLLPPIDGDALLQESLAASPVRLRWDLSPAQVDALAEAVMARSKAKCDAVASAHASGAALTWETCMQPLVEEDAEFSVMDSVLTFPGHVAADKTLRDTCTAADTRLSAYAIEASSRKDLFEATLAYAETEEAKALEGERKRCLERKLRDFRRVGLHLDDATAAEVKSINTRISDLGIQYKQNLGEESTSFSFDAAELEGCPETYLQERKQDDGSYKVTLKYPCYVPLMERCKVAATRQKMEKAFNSRCLEANTAILEELVQLRHKKAKLMGFETHADFVTTIRMSGGAGKVKTFLAELAEKLKPLLRSDLDEVRKMKQGDGYPADCEINAWDRSYYCKRIEESRHNVDHELLKQYFPLEVVAQGLLGIYQELLGLKFERHAELEKAAWHEEVQAFKVTDADTQGTVGYFYMDMHPRDGKYGHAACFGLQPACEYGGEWQVPVAAMVCNFPKPSAEKPALLSHGNVETFFHEFGHVMHQLCSKAKLAMFAGTRVERDFVEAPSQMLENWVWQPEALHRMSRHHKTGEPIPEELLQALLQSRNANAGILNMRQICLASFDQAIHTSASADTASVLAALTQELMSVPATPGTNMGASFGHLAGGYDAQYYGYMWSEVYSADMFVSRFEAEGIFSAAVGKSYRSEILAAGGSRDAMDSLRAFLGRDPIFEPFLKSKGLSAA